MSFKVNLQDNCSLGPWDAFILLCLQDLRFVFPRRWDYYFPFNFRPFLFQFHKAHRYSTLYV